MFDGMIISDMIQGKGVASRFDGNKVVNARYIGVRVKSNIHTGSIVGGDRGISHSQTL